MEQIYWILALVGTSLFVIKMALLFMGGDDGDGGFDGDVDVDVGDGDIDGGHIHGDDGQATTTAFKVLTLQTMSSFAMGAGWTGLAVLENTDLGDGPSVVPAFIAGVLFVMLLGYLMSKARALESSGTLDPKSAVGSIGNVYLTIPEVGRGQIQIEIQGRMATLDANSHQGPIPTGTRVRVEAVGSDGVLEVVAI